MTRGATMTSTTVAGLIFQAADQTRNRWLTWTDFGGVWHATINGTRYEVTPGWRIRVFQGTQVWDLTPANAGLAGNAGSALVDALLTSASF